MKIVVFSGAGISQESGVPTFRDSDGLWENHTVEDVASPKGWKDNKKLVLDFYNERRSQLPNVQPNKAHQLLAELEKHHDVTIVTQNVDDLHERAGSSKVIHLHGELTKSRGSFYEHKTSSLDPVYEIGYDNINEGDLCSQTGSQLRPHIVWFGEMPLDTEEAFTKLAEADVVLIVGTSLQITYTMDALAMIIESTDASFYYVDPKPSNYLDGFGEVTYIKKSATEGVQDFMDEMLQTSTS
ncbi:MAG: NAD-dependent deacetylase [uncultured marine phage]|uniref:NAD-dependent deacetylase n=1 Tax=uncultured marine phage TaxID=707152 RepID=A0A8D9FR51_9VIRU|nr:MAG: NAD-dependent deacetylase [uncultured marine phage]